MNTSRVRLRSLNSAFSLESIMCSLLRPGEVTKESFWETKSLEFVSYGGSDLRLLVSGSSSFDSYSGFSAIRLIMLTSDTVISRSVCLSMIVWRSRISFVLKVFIILTISSSFVSYSSAYSYKLANFLPLRSLRQQQMQQLPSKNTLQSLQVDTLIFLWC